MKSKRNSPSGKLLAVPVLLALTAGSLYAASITVTSPTSANSGHNGKPYAITWTKDGDMPDKVRISLRNSVSGAEVISIEETAPNTGTYNWTVPMDVALGEYRVRVKVKGAQISDDSVPFRILPEWLITYPTAPQRAVWQETKTYTLAWTWIGPWPSAPVKMTLTRVENGQFVFVRNIGSTQAGTFAWTVPGDIPIGYYTVKFELEGKSLRTERNIVISLPRGQVSVIKK